MARGQALVAERLAIVDSALARQEWLSGDAFGMGDIPMGCFVHTWFAMDIDRPMLPNLIDWHARLERRPAFRQHVMTALT
jgi:glutathione S-transferase